MSKKNLYCDISKVEDNEDGTITVSGFASSGAEDSEGETITPDAMKAAIPDYMKFGAVREMHQPSAAGTAVSIEVQDDGRTAFSALVVDDSAVKKVKTGVYKGFSIGGRVTERDPMNKKIIKGLNLVEVSLVDRPANPEALLTMYKADGGTGSTGTTPLKGVDGTMEPVDPPESIRKGLYSVGDFASLLNSLSWLVCDSIWEEQSEGDGSPIPAQLIAWLQTGTEILKAMTEEETAELIAGMRERANMPEVLEMAQKAGLKLDLKKAGAQFSAKTKAALADVHKSMKDCCDKMDALGYKTDDDGVESADTNTDVNKGAGLNDTNGIAGVEDLVNKALAPMKETLEKLGKENEELQKRLKEVLKQPAPPKAALMSVTKGADASSVTGNAPNASAPPEGTVERAEWEMRKVFATGRVA